VMVVEIGRSHLAFVARFAAPHRIGYVLPQHLFHADAIPVNEDTVEPYARLNIHIIRV
jgi:hypothetical protein